MCFVVRQHDDLIYTCSAAPTGLSEWQIDTNRQNDYIFAKGTSSFIETASLCVTNTGINGRHYTDKFYFAGEVLKGNGFHERFA
ncbi:hypothetical protein D3C80_2065310 [compost metagenome]